MKATAPPLFSISESRSWSLGDYQFELPERRRMWSVCAPLLALLGVWLAEWAALSRWTLDLPFDGWNTALVFLVGTCSIPLFFELRLGILALLRGKRTTSLSLFPGEVVMNRGIRVAWNRVRRIWLRRPPDRPDWKITFEWSEGKGFRLETFSLGFANNGETHKLIDGLLAPRRFEGAVYQIVEGAPPTPCSHAQRGRMLRRALGLFFVVHVAMIGAPAFLPTNGNKAENPPTIKKPIAESLPEPKNQGPELPKLAAGYIKSYYRTPEDYLKGFCPAMLAACALFAGRAWLTRLAAGYPCKRGLPENPL